jgi:hypothetical protein
VPADSPYSRPLAAPPSWLPLLESAKGEPGPGNESPLPGDGWPQLEAIEYVTKLALLLLLLLALPWLIGKLLTSPGEVAAHVAGPTGAAMGA